MTALAVVLGEAPASGRLAATEYVPAPAGETWEGPGVSVAVSGIDTSLAVSDDLVVAVAGRIPTERHPGVPREVAARRLERAWRRDGDDAFRNLPDDVVLVVVRLRERAVRVFRDLGGTVPAFLMTHHGRSVVTTSLPTLVRKSRHLTVDERWAGAYLRRAWPPPGVSPYREVLALPPGHVASGDADGWRHRLGDTFNFVDDVPLDLDTSARRFRDLFDDAVRRRVETIAGPVGVTLSGGLDSSSVAVTVRAVAPDADLVAVALAFQDSMGDERSYQEDAARAARARLAWVDPHQLTGPFGSSPAGLFERFGAPPLSGNWFLHEALVAAATAEGVLRVLDGEDGDGVVGVQPVYLADVLASGGPAALAREISALAAARRLPVRRLWQDALRASSRSARAGNWGRAHVAASRSLVSGGYLGALGAETHADWECVSGGIAHPFLDRGVLEYALAVPAAHKAQAGLGKLILRRALADRLPGSIANRPDKSRLSAPFVVALQGPQWEVLQDGLTAARRLTPDIRDVPVVDRSTSAEWQLYQGYRTAVVALWRSWVAERRTSAS